MKKQLILPIGLFVAGIAMGGYYFLPAKVQEAPKSQPVPPVAGNTVVVNMAGIKYDKTEITINLGDTVKFVNSGDDDYWPASNIHPSHRIYPEFDPKRPVPKGESWSFTFDKKGEWRMHDHIHPQIKGTVTVN